VGKPCPGGEEELAGEVRVFFLAGVEDGAGPDDGLGEHLPTRLWSNIGLDRIPGGAGYG